MRLSGITVDQEMLDEIIRLVGSVTWEIPTLGAKIETYRDDDFLTFTSKSGIEKVLFPVDLTGKVENDDRFVEWLKENRPEVFI